MQESPKKPKSARSFRGRLLGLITLGILGLALTAALTTAWVTGSRAADQMVAQGLKVVETLADQSVLALLYESQANAEKPLQTVMSFPDVDHAAIFNHEWQTLAVAGIKSLRIPESDANQPLTHARLINETSQAWYFIAPVMVADRNEALADGDFQLQLDPLQTEVLGYAYLVMDKANLRAMQISITQNNILIAFSFAIILTFLVNIGIDHLTRPLYQLIQVMEKNEREQTRTYADIYGPKEITNLASVFNSMMGSLDEQERKLREHKEMLESEVQLRTRELVEARDAALTASRHKSEFLANMSHELRTPLQAIIGYADVVKEELEMEGMDDNAEELNRVIRNADRLLSLINKILDMAKIESGKMDLRLQPVALANLHNDIREAILPIIKHNNNRLEFNLNPGQCEVRIDREKLLQMILNLLSNAGKFTENGLITLNTQLTDSLLTIKVTDTGIGLTKAQQRVIFEEFRQVDGSNTRDFEGTGLGLAITKRFAELMGGQIEVKSEPAKGSSFKILIPLPIKQYAKTSLPEFTKENSKDYIATS